MRPRWALDAVDRLFMVGDVVITTKHSHLGPGVVGEVTEVIADGITVSTDLTPHGHVTVWCRHVLVQRRHTGVVAWARRTWKRVSERTST